MKLRKLFAWLMTLVMLLGMVPTAQAEVINCDHNWAWRWPNGQPANCQEWKWSEKYCTKCGVGDGGFEQCGPCVPGDKTWVVPQASNCQEHGVWEITCKYCGEWLEGMEEPGPHNWRETIVEEPWCDVGGMKAMICSVCGEWQGNGTPLEPLGHVWESQVVDQPGCTLPGWEESFCSRCGDEKGDGHEIPPTGHDWGDWVWDATVSCEQGAWKHRNCSRCRMREEEWVDASGHQWGSWSTVSAGTCETPAKEERTCSVCGKKDSRDGAYGNHNWSTQTTLEPTCDADGYKETICTVCGSEQGNPETLPALGHDWGEWHWANEEPTCEQGAWQVRECKRCGCIDDRWVEGGQHQWGSWSTVSTGNCVTPAKEKRTCSVCGKTEERDGAYGDHNYGDWIIDEEATCTKRGLKYSECSNCHDKDWVYIDMVDHVFGEWYVISEPQIGLPGVEQRDCTFGCGTFEQRELPALDQDFGDEDPVRVEGLKLTLTLDSTPANGKYFVVGEQVTFTASWSNLSPFELFPFYVSIWPYEQPSRDSQDLPYSCSFDAEEVITPGMTGSHSMVITVTEEDVARGGIYAMAYIWSSVHNGPELEEVTTPFVTAPCGADEVDLSGLIVTKTASAGSNSDPCKPGDEVTFTITVTNNTGVELLDVEITDPIKGGNEDSIVDIIPSMQPGESVTAAFGYTVTEEDATVGVEGFENTAYASGHTADGTQVSGTSETIFVWCVIPHEIILTKSVANTPANGEFFVPGETIVFDISMIDNTPYPLYNITLTDPLCQDQYNYDAVNDMSYLYFGELYPEGNAMGERSSATVTVNYVVTEADAEAGSVTNTAEVTYQTWYGKEMSDSDDVTAPCGVGEPMNSAGVRLEKALRNAPANGEFYVPGEVLNYALTLRLDDGLLLDDAAIYDPIAGGDGLVISYGKGLYGGMGNDVFYVVTEEDAQRGYVENTAYATWIYQDSGEAGRCESETVIAPCGMGELPDDYQAPGSVRLTLTEWSSPANGTHYVPGERINVHHRLYNNSRDVTMTIDHEHYFLICGDGAKEGDDSFSSSKVLRPGSGYSVYWWPRVTEADAARGYVEKTTTYYLMGDDGNEYTATGSIRLPCGPGELPDDYVPPVIPDIDEDGIPNEEDPDIDGDGIPNGEDDDIDGDGIPNEEDDDIDGDGTPNGNDPDVDGDGTPNGEDPDVDGDGTPNGDDPDVDGDGTPNGEDPDVDGDGTPNGSDPDIDGDGIPNEEDPTPDGGTPDADMGLSGALSVTKTVTSTPANGSFYTPGETVTFSVYVVNTGDPLNNLCVSDWMWEQSRAFGTINTNEDVTYPVSYTVTELDAVSGSVSNIAFAEAVAANGDPVMEYSNNVTVPCGFTEGDDPFGIFHSVAVVKKEESLPMNGQFYTEGEVIHYTITYTNDGELPLTDVEIWDILDVSTPIATAETLQPGESRVCYYQHTVNAEDVAFGSVMNVAHASYPVPGAAGFATSSSNVVISKTDAYDWLWGIPIFPDPGEDPEYDPGTGWFPGEDPVPGGDTPPFGTIDTDTLHSGDAYCVRTITGRDNASATYETSYCTEHVDAQSFMLLMKAGAITPEAQLQNAAYAVALWRNEVEALYQELFKAADPQARAVVMTEYIRFQTEMANYEMLLKALYPDQPAIAAEKVAAMWEDKCVDMCYEMHANAAERKDNLLSVVPGAGAAAVSCGCTVTAEENGGKTVTQSYCSVHGFPFSMIDAMLQGKDTAESWTMVRQIWRVELDKAYNQAAAKLGASNALAMAEYHVLTQWMMGREATLIALYPDNPELVAQIMVKLIMNRVNDLCGAVK